MDYTYSLRILILVLAFLTVLVLYYFFTKSTKNKLSKNPTINPLLDYDVDPESLEYLVTGTSGGVIRNVQNLGTYEHNSEWFWLVQADYEPKCSNGFPKPKTGLYKERLKTA